MRYAIFIWTRLSILLLIALSSAALAEYVQADQVVFEDDFSGTTIDPAKWRVFCRHNYPQIDGWEPWWLYTFWEQNDSLQLRVTHENLVTAAARSRQRFTEGCTSYEVEVWQDDDSGWQDWPIGFTTPYGGFGYYNAGRGWNIAWTGADGGHGSLDNVFPETAQPWVHYRLKIAREGDLLCWYIDNSDGTGYRLVHSTSDFRFPYVIPGHLVASNQPVYHVWLTNTDLGVTRYDNVVVRGTLGQLREGIVFVSDRGGNRDIWIMEADGSRPRQLTTNPGLDDMPVPAPPSGFRAGGLIAYVSDDGNPAAGTGELPNTDIWIMDPDGANKTRLTHEGTAYCSQPQWSDEACYIVYVKKRDDQAPELWRVNAITGTDVQLTSAGVTHKNPEWCGGCQVVYDKDAGGGGWWELWATNPGGSDARALATSHHSISPAVCHAGGKPYGAPSTSRVAYVRALLSTSQVRVVDIDGTDDELVFDNSAWAYDGWGQVAWSPDDSLLAAAVYPSLHPGVPEFDSFVQILDPETGTEIFRTAQGRNTFALESSLYDDFKFSAGDRVWSEDGSRLVFMSNRDGNWEIYAVGADGFNEANLTQNGEYDGSPCWIALEGEAPTGRVLLDHSHTTSPSAWFMLTAEEIAGLGFWADEVTDFPADLSQWDALVIQCPDIAYTEDETNRIASFAAAGGGVLIANDWDYGTSRYTNVVNPILANWSFSAVETNAGNGPYTVANGQLKEHPITTVPNLLASVNGALVSRLEVPQNAAIVIQDGSAVIAAAAEPEAGRLVVAGEDDLIIGDYGPENPLFLQNILTWLCEQREPGLGLLSSGYVVPTTADTAARFTWRIKYWNTGSTPPTSVWVAIWSSATGTTRWHPMWEYEPSDTNCVDGKWYTYSCRLTAGSHAYRFGAQVGAQWIYWPQPAGSYRSGPSVAQGSPVVLSSGYVMPASGTRSTDFTWRVKYWNASNAAPEQVWVAIWFPTLKRSCWHRMWPYDLSDTNRRDGAWYTFSRRWLPPGAYAYRFAAKQGEDWAYWPKPAGSYASGPIVNP